MGAMQRILVSGRVQQVGYRDYMVRKAQALGVRGWVRNLTDGRVEMLADGDDAAIEAFLAATREGPAMARVDDVVTVPTDDRAVKGFTKRFTA